jgi:hypothetical protein
VFCYFIASVGVTTGICLREYLRGLGINGGELDLIICGLPSYDVADWKKNTVYKGTKIESTVKYFWDLMEQLSDEERAAVVRFATGSAGVPVGGFANLRGRQARNEAATENFKIHCTRPVPSASCVACRDVCTCRLPQVRDLPPPPVCGGYPLYIPVYIPWPVHAAAALTSDGGPGSRTHASTRWTCLRIRRSTFSR